MREDLYEELKPIFSQIYHNYWLRRRFFSLDNKGRQSRHLLLVFMSELVYWEYERSFWEKLYKTLKADSRGYNWFTTQMVRGYDENNIPLIRSGYGWWERKEYVRTIIGESGFSRQLVQQAKQFVIWFFDNHAALDPRTLDAESFDQILDESGFIWNKGEIFELLRDMVGTVNRLLREIRRQSLTSADLRKPDVLAKLEKTLGFHPVRGIFGFRKEEDIQELLEQLSARVRPQAFYTMLKRKTRTRKTSLWLMTPEKKILEVKQAKDVSVIFGEYRLLDADQSQIQVVPREALTLSRMGEMIQCSRGTFHQDGPSYAWIHDNEPFEVYQGNVEPEEPRSYYIDDHRGYLWYGRQKIGMPLQAEREGQVIANLGPRSDISLNPRLRLTRDSTGLVVVIPSFVCFEPTLSGQTVRLELNGRPVENTTYVIGRNGSLQLQGTRVAEVLPEDRHLEVRLVTVDENKTVLKRTIYKSLCRNLLFNKISRELIRPGYQYYSGNKFVLFTTAEDSAIDISDDTKVELTSNFGIFRFLHLNWKPNSNNLQPFSLKIGEERWQFTKPLEVYARLYCPSSSGVFQPQDHATFDPDNLEIHLHISGQPDEVSEVRGKLSFIIEKDNEFLTDFPLQELENLGALKDAYAEGEFIIDSSRLLRYLIGQGLTDKQIGTYTWTLMLRPNPLADLEPLSELEFMLLPKLQVIGLDAIMAEGERGLVSVSCEYPLLATDDGDQPTQVLQVECKPQAIFNIQSKRLEAKIVESTLRLAYPLTKVSLRFLPNLFAIRLVERGMVLPQPKIAYDKYGRGYLTILAPPKDLVQVDCNDNIETVEIDDSGQGRYPIHRLLPIIEEHHTQVNVSCGEKQKTFEIIWRPSILFDTEKCYLEINSEKTGILNLHFKTVEGPASTQICLRISDNRLRSHGQYAVELAGLKKHTVKFPISLDKLQNAISLHVRASTNGNTLDTVKILCKDISLEEANRQAAEDSQRIIEAIDHANILELPDLLERLEDVAQRELLEYALQQAFSTKRLDQVFPARKNMPLERITAYFRSFQPSMLPDQDSVTTPALKRYCVIPAPNLQLACAERLIAQGDGAGVECIIDLIEQGEIPTNKGLQILHQNECCTSEMICDMVSWDDLEFTSDEYIDLMIELSKAFHPAVTRRAMAAKDWKRALDLRQSQEAFDEKVIGWDPNGLIIPIGLVTGIVPIEELNARRYGLKGDRKNIRKHLSELVNTTLKLVVLRANRREGELILSQWRAEKISADALIAKLEKGNIREGIVTNVLDFGAFVDLGGIDGLVHISELSWERIRHPRDVLSIGDQMEFYVLNVDRNLRRVELSLKKLLPDPWLQIAQKYTIGQLVQGRVTKIMDFEAFVLVEEEIEGLVHISELSPMNISHPREAVNKGDTLTLRILRVDQENRRLVLSLKQVGDENLFWGQMRVKI